MASLGISKRVASHGGASHPGNLRGFMEECIVIQEENEDIPIPSNGSLGKCAGAKPQMDVRSFIHVVLVISLTVITCVTSHFCVTA